MKVKIERLTTDYPNWQTAKAELNQLPLVAEEGVPNSVSLVSLDI
jgi:hypothetical protein